MLSFSKISSLALALTLVGGVGVANVASASATPHSQAAQHLAEGGSDRLLERRVAEGGSDRLLERRVAEGGSDRLLENRVAEGGADRLQELRERSAATVA